MAATKANIYFKGVEIPTSSHPEIKKLKKKSNVHYMHGNKVWNSTLILMDLFSDMSFEDQKIADLGCGWGALSCFLTKKGADITGIDSDLNVKPYFDLMCKLMDVDTKFCVQNIFSDEFDISPYKTFLASDVCFWDAQTDLWINFINKIIKQDTQLIMCDPGRESFWNLLDNCNAPYQIINQKINKPRKVDAYITIFGE